MTRWRPHLANTGYGTVRLNAFTYPQLNRSVTFTSQPTATRPHLLADIRQRGNVAAWPFRAPESKCFVQARHFQALEDNTIYLFPPLLPPHTVSISSSYNACYDFHAVSLDYGAVKSRGRHGKSSGLLHTPVQYHRTRNTRGAPSTNFLSLRQANHRSRPVLPWHDAQFPRTHDVFSSHRHCYNIV